MTEMTEALSQKLASLVTHVKEGAATFNWPEAQKIIDDEEVRAWVAGVGFFTPIPAAEPKPAPRKKAKKKMPKKAKRKARR